MKHKFKELKRWRNLLKSTCPKHRERDRNVQKERGIMPLNSAPPPKKNQTQTNNKPLENLHGTWTGQKIEDETQNHEGRVLAGHNQDKTFPASFISSPGGRRESV